MPRVLVPVVVEVRRREVAELLLVEADTRRGDLLVVSDDDDFRRQILQECCLESRLRCLVDNYNVEGVLLDRKSVV